MPSSLRVLSLETIGLASQTTIVFRRELPMIGRVVPAIRRDLVAWLALSVALGGTSMATPHYVITSTKQVKPSILARLQGSKGRLDRLQDRHRRRVAHPGPAVLRRADSRGRRRIRASGLRDAGRGEHCVTSGRAICNGAGSRARLTRKGVTGTWGYAAGVVYWPELSRTSIWRMREDGCAGTVVLRKRRTIRPLVQIVKESFRVQDA